jgi:hypothetical protein
MYFVAPLLGANEKAMQRIDDGIFAVLVFRVTRWQEDEDVTIGGLTFKIAFESGSVNFNVLDCDRLCTGNYGRDNGFHLRGQSGRGD